MSTHQKPWVYATPKIAIAATYLGDNYDFICQTGPVNEDPYIYEQFEGALKHAYKGKKGAIYTLPSKSFRQEPSLLSGELISEKPVKVLKEVVILDALEFLLELEKEGKLKIYYYPDKPKHVPQDKGGIISRAIAWSFDHYNSNKRDYYLDEIEKYHPDILKQVAKELKIRYFKPQTKKWQNYFEKIKVKKTEYK